MKKSSIYRIAIVLCIAIAAFFGIRKLTEPKLVEGAKAIQVTVQVQQEDNSYKTVYDDTVHTDTELLADLLLEMDEKGLLQVTLSGNKSDPYGRSLSGMAETEITDWNTGPWWLYNSDNNVDCVKAGYCSGVDSCPVYDGDHFVFQFTSSY